LSDLIIPPEPPEVKKYILDVRERLGPGGDIDWDSLAVWAGNRVQSYLWRCWKDTLERKGFTWQRFLRLMKYATGDAVLWISGKMVWENFVNKVLERLEGPLAEMIINR
jgi:hypothetical protein